MNYANVRITATLLKRCNILIVKSFGEVGPYLLKGFSSNKFCSLWQRVQPIS
jgi:hypothetical protein